MAIDSEFLLVLQWAGKSKTAKDCYSMKYNEKSMPQILMPQKYSRAGQTVATDSFIMTVKTSDPTDGVSLQFDYIPDSGLEKFQKYQKYQQHGEDWTITLPYSPTTRSHIWIRFMPRTTETTHTSNPILTLIDSDTGDTFNPATNYLQKCAADSNYSTYLVNKRREEVEQECQQLTNHNMELQQKCSQYDIQVRNAEVKINELMQQLKEKTDEIRNLQSELWQASKLAQRSKEPGARHSATVISSMLIFAIILLLAFYVSQSTDYSW